MLVGIIVGLIIGLFNAVTVSGIITEVICNGLG